MLQPFEEYIHAEIECIEREAGGADSVDTQNARVIEWIRNNAPRFREQWNSEHSAELA